MKVGVIGLGLVGGSIAKRCQERGCDVSGFDILPGTRALAAREGIHSASLEEMADECDIVIVATSAKVAIDEIEKLLLFGARSVADVASIKEPLVRGLSHLPQDLRSRYIATHPMAGAQTSGFSSSRSDLLDRCTWAVSGDPELDTFLLFSRLAEFFDASLVPVLPREHDRAVARSSHLVQLLHSCLAAGLVDESKTTLLLSGPALRDTTRLAESPLEGFWQEVLSENEEFVTEAMEEFLEELQGGGDIKDIWRHAALGRERLLQSRWEEKRWREYSLPLSSWWPDLLRLGQEGSSIKEARKEDYLLLFKRS